MHHFINSFIYSKRKNIFLESLYVFWSVTGKERNALTFSRINVSRNALKLSRNIFVELCANNYHSSIFSAGVTIDLLTKITKMCFFFLFASIVALIARNSRDKCENWERSGSRWNLAAIECNLFRCPCSKSVAGRENRLRFPSNAHVFFCLSKCSTSQS